MPVPTDPAQVRGKASTPFAYGPNMGNQIYSIPPPGPTVPPPTGFGSRGIDPIGPGPTQPPMNAPTQGGPQEQFNTPAMQMQLPPQQATWGVQPQLSGGFQYGGARSGGMNDPRLAQQAFAAFNHQAALHHQIRQFMAAQASGISPEPTPIPGNFGGGGWFPAYDATMQLATNPSITVTGGSPSGISQWGGYGGFGPGYVPLGMMASGPGGAMMPWFQGPLFPGAGDYAPGYGGNAWGGIQGGAGATGNAGPGGNGPISARYSHQA